VLYFVQPRTVLEWQKKRFRDYWRALSRAGRPGRPEHSSDGDDQMDEEKGKVAHDPKIVLMRFRLASLGFFSCLRYELAIRHPQVVRDFLPYGPVQVEAGASFVLTNKLLVWY
jgi:hypothetical protein